MKLSINIVFLIAIFFIREHECTLNLLKVDVNYYDRTLANEENLQAPLYKYNETDNIDVLHWDLKKDLPEDIHLKSNVYLLNNDGQREKLLLETDIPICKESPYRKYLNNFLRVPKSRLGSKCIKKGNHYVRVTELDIEGLIPNLGSIGKYFEVDNVIIGKNKPIVGWKSISEYIHN